MSLFTEDLWVRLWEDGGYVVKFKMKVAKSKGCLKQRGIFLDSSGQFFRQLKAIWRFEANASNVAWEKWEGNAVQEQEVIVLQRQENGTSAKQKARVQKFTTHRGSSILGQHQKNMELHQYTLVDQCIEYNRNRMWYKN
jgi:hypothetical protein